MTRYYNDYLIQSDDTLTHYGVLGMKWGVRRYQNKDGTLTKAGKRKYKISPDGNVEKRSYKERKEYDKKVSSLKKANEEKKKKAAIREKALKNNDLDLISKHSNMFTTEEINNAVNRNRSLIELQNSRRVKATEAKKWIDTAVSYGQTLQNAYRLVSSNEVQGLISAYNNSTDSHIPLAPNSYDNYMKIYKDGDNKK